MFSAPQSLEFQDEAKLRFEFQAVVPAHAPSQISAPHGLMAGRH